VNTLQLGVLVQTFFDLTILFFFQPSVTAGSKAIGSRKLLKKGVHTNKLPTPIAEQIADEVVHLLIF